MAESGKCGPQAGVGREASGEGPRQLVLAEMESYHRLTKQQHAYAVARGRLPTNIPDWQCRLIADGWSEADIKAVGRKQSNAISANLAKWNAMPSVQAVIEYERAVALETRLAEPLRAWEARMERLLAMAAGELPQVRTVVQVVEDEQGTGPAERILTAEEYWESNLSAMAKALEMQGRALSVFRDRTELSGPDGAAAIQVLFVPPGGAAEEASGPDQGRPGAVIDACPSRGA